MEVTPSVESNDESNPDWNEPSIPAVQKQKQIFLFFKTLRRNRSLRSPLLPSFSPISRHGNGGSATNPACAARLTRQG
jgi:hypothetical protein